MKRRQAPIGARLLHDHRALPIWNDFFFPLVLITCDNLKTLPQG